MDDQSDPSHRILTPARSPQAPPRLSMRRNSAFAVSSHIRQDKPSKLGKALSGSIHLLSNVFKASGEQELSKTRASVNSNATGSLMMKQAKREHKECKPIDKSFQEKCRDMKEAYSGCPRWVAGQMLGGTILMMVSNANQGLSFPIFGFGFACFVVVFMFLSIWKVISKRWESSAPYYYSSCFMFLLLVFSTNKSLEYLLYVSWNTSLLGLMVHTQSRRIWRHMIVCTLLNVLIFHLARSIRIGLTTFCEIGLCTTSSFHKDITLTIWNCITMIAFLFYDIKLHPKEHQYIQDWEDIQRLVIDNLDLQHQLRVANFKTESDIIAPLTRAIQILVGLQNKTSASEKTKSDLEYVVSMLNSDRLFQPDIFEDIGDRDVTSFLQNVLQTRKNTYLKPKLQSKIHPPSIPQQYQTASQIVNLLESAQNKFFNVFDLEVVSDGHALYYLAANLFQEYDFQMKLGINERMFRNWLLKMESGYERKNTYHNGTHAADVLHCLNYFITRDCIANKMTAEETFAAIVAAIGHDYMHPGFTNAFLVATRHPLALRYNDQSVLEQFHSASLFEIFTQSEYDILSGMATEQKIHIREIITSMILATDMAFHFEWLSKFKSKISANSLNMDNKNDKKMVLNMAIKCSDVNNLSKPLPISRIWAQLIMEEFFRQGDEEKARGLPISMFMDRSSTDIPKCQLGFIDFIVLPLYEALQSFMPGDIEDHVKNIQTTKQYWKSISENHLPVEPVEIPKFSFTPLRSTKSGDNSNSSLNKKTTELSSPLASRDFKTDTQKEPSNAFSFLKRLTTRARTTTQGTIPDPDGQLLSISNDREIRQRALTQQQPRQKREFSITLETSLGNAHSDSLQSDMQMFPNEPKSREFPIPPLLNPRHSETRPRPAFDE